MRPWRCAADVAFTGKAWRGELIPLAGFVLRNGILGPFHWGTAWKFAVVPFIAGECLLECLPSPADWSLARLSAIPLLLLGISGFLWRKAH